MNSRIRDLIEYKDGKLYWKEARGRSYSLKEAGTVAANGRVYLQIEGKKHLAHRVTWMIHHGECPEFLDHIDGNPLNNRIKNLRPATKSQNAMNRKVKSDNILGIKGVCKRKNKYAAQIRNGEKKIFLGLYETAEMAGEVYKQAAVKQFGEFAHG
jgi:hypothetical protein